MGIPCLDLTTVVQKFTNRIGNTRHAVRKTADHALDAVNDAADNVRTPAPGIGSKPLHKVHSGIETVLDRIDNARNLLRNGGLDILPDA